jgi:hypothetical protein
MAAKSKGQSVVSFVRKPKKKNPGIHAKSKSSKNKNSKNYTKVYVSQGK